MIEFFMGGGYASFLVVVLAGLTVVASARFAWRPRERFVATLRTLSTATVFAILGGLLVNFHAVMTKVPALPAESGPLLLLIMEGLPEAVVPAVFGFLMLSLAWLFAAAGVRRLGREDQAIV